MAFKVLPDGKSLPICHQFVQYLIVFDIKMEDFRQKARLVAGGNVTEAPATITHVSVVSRATERIALMIAALNDLEVKSGDVLNVYVHSPVTEKVWTTLGSEFGKDAGKTAMIVRAIYGQKSTGTAFRSHLAKCIESLRYQSCKTDPDLWLQPETIPEDGVKYYLYLVCYVEDILSIHHNADSVLEWLHKSFPLKLGFSNADMCLGAKLHKTRLHSGVWA